MSSHPAEYLPSNAVHNRTNRTSGVNKKCWEKGAVHTYIIGGWYILAWPALPVFVLHITVVNDNYIMHANNNIITASIQHIRTPHYVYSYIHQSVTRIKRVNFVLRLDHQYSKYMTILVVMKMFSAGRGYMYKPWRSV